jgi:hypothetical protein
MTTTRPSHRRRTEPETERAIFRRRKRPTNLALGGLLALFAALVYLVAIVRMGSQ